MNSIELPPIMENSKHGNISILNSPEMRRLSYKSEFSSKGNSKSSQSHGSSGSSYANFGHHRNSIVSSEETRDLRSWNKSENSSRGNKIRLEPLVDTPRTGKNSMLSINDLDILSRNKLDEKSKKFGSLNQNKNKSQTIHLTRNKTVVEDGTVIPRNSLLGKRLLSIQNMSSLTKNKKVEIEIVKGLRRYSSALELYMDKNEFPIYEPNVDGEENFDDDDDEKEYYIIEWLRGIEEREAPPEQEIDYIEEKTQKDTAIHIVYGEE